MNNCSLFGDFEPEKFGFATVTRKRFPEPNYIIYTTNSKKQKMEITIENEEAERIIEYYGGDRFNYEIDSKSGVIFLWPYDADRDEGKGNQLYTCDGSGYYRMSIAKNRDKLISAIGKFRRMTILVVQNTNHLLIIPDTRNNNNEY